MTETVLNKIISDVKEQLQYEERCNDAFREIFPDSYPPVFENMLWTALSTAVDEALGVDDLFGWWIWETDCGTKDNAWIELKGRRWPITNAREMLAFAEAYRGQNNED